MYEENLDLLDSSPALWTAQELPKSQMEKMQKKMKLFPLDNVCFALLWLL